MIRYIIVDDETASHEIIKDYASNLPELSFKTSCYNALEAIQYLNKESVDLIFLDINMPKLSGLDFLRTLSNPPKVIITTAYREYAVEGFELSVDDYLVKPFSFLRFVKSINKVFNSQTSSLEENNGTSYTSKIFIKEDKKYHQISLTDILFIEAYGNYVKVVLLDRVIISHQTLISFSNTLPQDRFIRVHKSYMVSKEKIDSVEGNQIQIQEYKIPIGKMYKSNVNSLLQ